ncbi:FadR family transcriptional regulator [Pseudomonas sp. WS 5059]|uniref:FadR/GntR family transcriptional regulator n=1 Tax=Pseudomonas sp. WS 5059 TaxID=2717491 RepID=UPI0014748F11|nr:FadR/GntR family transcriptional regulator [Pseudomonas sp. WS 5059]NMY01927.1 FadR family transcriptional regulator [Pseudomonas sp. WS 5059]
MPTADKSSCSADALGILKDAAKGTLSDQVTAALKAYIANGEALPGDRLPTEPVLAERFGVSRTVIREAISRLKSAGLVEVRQGSGTVVSEGAHIKAFTIDLDVGGSIEAVLRVTELRRGIEGEAAALAAQRHSPAQLEAIHQALKAIDTAEQGGRDGVEEDLAFHHSISKATGNPLYPSLHEFIAQFIKEAIRITRSNEERRRDLAKTVRAEHFAVYAAIAARDPQAARQAALEHINNAVERLKSADPAFWQSPGARKG